VFAEIFQRARERIGSVGLGGNGQFVRLSALQTLGPSPWSGCLTEDLDLGLRLLLSGWTNRYCPTEHVSQQAVPTTRRWFRQRSRWFQGHLQCWRLIPRIGRSRLPRKTRLDLLWYLTAPSAILVVPLVTVLLVLGVTALVVQGQVDGVRTLSRHGAVVLLVYVLSFGSAYVFGAIYWLRGRSTLPRAILLGHAFELYSNLWFVAAWVAVWRIVAGRATWAKTERTTELTAAARTEGLRLR
jgi:1,2-diacylglycerol 3-beta-glucosyltransferase